VTCDKRQAAGRKQRRVTLLATCRLLFTTYFLLLAASCDLAPSAPPPPTLTVFAAASLADVFAEIGKGFEAARPGVKVVFNFGGSQALRAQLEQGAVADVFAPASEAEMEKAAASGLVASGGARPFAVNRLVVILPKDNPAKVEKLEDLARPGIKIVLAAEVVPAGQYTRAALDKMEKQFGSGFKDRVLANLASSEDNVRQVVVKVQLGEADAGFAYASDALAAPELQTIPLPAEYNVVAAYPIAVLTSAPHPDLAAEFVEYVLSAEGQAALTKWGFGK